MITIEKPILFPDTYPLERIGGQEDILFFDIETTGFSGDYSRLYLIGCTYCRRGQWNLIQWFADTAEAEKELLDAFFSFLEGFPILVHFNGDRFDLPFLLKRCSRLGLSYSLPDITSIDIYRRIKPYRRLLGLDSLKQKSIEHFLGIFRTDIYSGGELIEVYEKYLLTHDSHLYELLLLHNEEDLTGMPSILPILCYPDFLEHPFRLSGHKIHWEQGKNGERLHLLDLIFQSDFSVPVPFDVTKAPFRCHGEKNLLFLSAELFDGTLKHFYPNYQDYYYLIYEDTAIHKSVGEYVDRDARKKATAKTCYTKKEDCFLPQPEEIWEPIMKNDLKDKLSYAPFSCVSFEDSKQFSRYAAAVFIYMGI